MKNTAQQDDRYVQCLADQQMKKWTKINPAWVKHMPGQGLQRADILTPTKGVAGENFQKQPAPPAKVTSISNGPGSKDAVNSKQAAPVAAQKPAGISPFWTWGALASAAYLLFRKR